MVLDADDTFVNQAGGMFEARKTSDFDAYGTGGNDLFVNQAGGTVHTAGNANAAETTRFVNLERFENQGLISLQDGATGDSFTISNTPGGKNLNFIASGNSTLAVDAFLGGPGNSSVGHLHDPRQCVRHDHGPGEQHQYRSRRVQPDGIPVVFVTGATPTGNEFSLAKPIDTGFFDYDLFFTPTGSRLTGPQVLSGRRRASAAAARHGGAGHLARRLIHLVRPHGGFARAAERWRRARRL